jgi:hypothetical protein
MPVILALLSILFSFSVPAYGQDYHYRYGNARVVNQNQTGLAMPSGSYIGSGTLSATARGDYGQNKANANLPGCNMGGYIRTPGDNVYYNYNQQQRRGGYQYFQRPILQQPNYINQPRKDQVMMY